MTKIDFVELFDSRYIRNTVFLPSYRDRLRMGELSLPYLSNDLPTQREFF
jgi:hypothetical protein